jgi:steroid 5-alpha reductase family enzyme
MILETISIQSLLAANLGAVVVMMLLLWGISILLRDVSFIDSFWAFGFVLIGCVTIRLFPFGGVHQFLLTTLVVVWGFRLGFYLLLRWQREGVDGRYLNLIKKAKGNVHLYTLQYVFLLQGALMWIVSLPIQLGGYGATGPLGALAMAGAVLSVIGILFESIGDWQLFQFKRQPLNQGKVLDTGLWRYTRHPNYFGDLCFWWGCYLIACEAPYGWMAIPGPLVMSFLLIKWSGAALLERRVQRSRPDYADYMRRTSAFIPWPPKGT